MSYITKLYVPGMPSPGKVNRYFVLSAILRERGWNGVGDLWHAPDHLGYPAGSGGKERHTFEEALKCTGLGNWYDWAVIQEIMERNAFVAGRKLQKSAEAASAAFGRLGEDYRRRFGAALNGGK